MGTPTALYRRFRPARFDGLIGQEHNALALRNQVASGRHGHAYLFSGPRGCGKTSAARILGAALNCTSNPSGPPADGEPCGECASCRSVVEGTSADVFELDAASNSSVDAIRDLLSRVSLASPGRTKTYIIDECHMLSAAASAALLKTLEEPPSHVVFVLATTNPEKLLATIASRTQHLAFRLVPADQLAVHLSQVAAQAGLDVDDAVIAQAASAGRGSVRDALSALDSARFGAAVDASASHAALVAAAVFDADVAAALSAVAAAHTAGVDTRELIAAVVRVCRDWFLVTQGAADLVSVPVTESDHELLRRVGPRPIVALLEAAGEVGSSRLAALDLRAAFEVVVVRLCHTDTAATLAAHAARIAELERRLHAAGVPA